MPIDPRIINQIQPVQTERPYDRTLRGLQLQNTMLQNRAGQMNLTAAEQQLEQQRAQQKKDAVIGRVLLQAGGDMEKALPAIRQIDPQYALSVEETLSELKERKAQIAKTQEETTGARTEREQEAAERKRARRERTIQRLSSAPEQFLPQAYQMERGGLSEMIGQELPPADQFEQQMGMPLSAWVQGQLGEGRPEVETPAPRLITTVDEQGNEVQRFVTPEAGAQFPVAPETRTPTRFERELAMFRDDPEEFRRFMGRDPELATDLLSEADLGVSEEDTLWNRLGWFTTGPLSTIPRTVGRLTGTGQESLGNIQAFESAKQTMLRALAENPRFAVAEAERLAREVDVQPNKWDSVTTLRTRMREIDRHLESVEQRRAQTGDTAAVLAIRQFRNQMGVPQDDEPTQGSGPQVGDTREYQGAQYRFDGSEWVRQ